MKTNSFNGQRGMVLVTSLLMLVLVTILAIGMFRSFGVDERIAGNMREKQRALNAAETAEQYAEQWLSGGAVTPAITCTGPVSSTPGQLCASTLQAQGLDPAVLPWPAQVNYIPATPVAMTMSTTGGAGTYYNNPSYYVGFLNTATVNGVTTTYYQIDAVGYGGSANTAAVVEATYQVQANSPCLSCTQ